ncbi:hypothetical protein B0H13DRAFT_2261080 [Mycena leptocephala]|nr:hypothetical protein B0H13DRAFT_2261080 [Mycena leptocephala]
MAELESAQPREDDPFFEENFNHCTGRFSTAVTVTARVAALLASIIGLTLVIAVPEILDSNAPLANGNMQLQMEQESNAFPLAAHFIRLELCRRAERLFCYRDSQTVLETVRHAQYTSQTTIADLHVPHPTLAPVSTQLAIPQDVGDSSSTVDKNSEIMRRMWRKFRAAEWNGKPVNIYLNTSIPTVRHATMYSASRFFDIRGDLFYHRRPKIDNKERVSLFSKHFLEKLNVRRSECLQYYEENDALKRYVMLSACALDLTATQAHTGWIRLLAEDDLSHFLGISGQRIEVMVVRGGCEMIEKFDSSWRTSPLIAASHSKPPSGFFFGPRATRRPASTSKRRDFIRRLREGPIMSLYDSYRAILAMYFDEVDDAAMMTLFRRVMGWILLVRTAQSRRVFRAFAVALLPEEEQSDVDHILGTTSEGDPISPLHTSLRDFLLDATKSGTFSLDLGPHLQENFLGHV